MSDSMEIISIRRIQWQRAKGELMGFLETFWPEYDRHSKKIDNGFEQHQERIELFIKDMEDYL